MLDQARRKAATSKQRLRDLAQREEMWIFYYLAQLLHC
jgi:hypothetical protein